MNLFKSRRNEPPELDDDFLPQPIDTDNSVFLDSLETVTPEELAPDAAGEKAVSAGAYYPRR